MVHSSQAPKEAIQVTLNLLKEKQVNFRGIHLIVTRSTILTSIRAMERTVTITLLINNNLWQYKIKITINNQD